MMSVGGLATGMAHEINNTLAGMIQNAELLGRRLLDISLPSNVRAAEALCLDLALVQSYMESRGVPRMVSAIKETGGRIAEIVDNMLSFSRKNDAQKSRHAITELLDNTVELAGTDFSLKKHYDFKSIAIIKHYEKDLPQVPCEPTKIQQVFLNILNNGAQAMQGAKIDASKFSLAVRVDRIAEMICIDIEDNGPGIEEEVYYQKYCPAGLQ